MMRNAPELQDLMRFRHMVRHDYGTSMRHEELLEKLAFAEDLLLPDLKAGLRETIAFLETGFENSGGDEPSAR